MMRAALCALCSLALCGAEADRFLVVDERVEALHQNRHCLAYALGVAHKAGMVFVAPTYVDGKVRDPDARLPDALDFLDVRRAAAALGGGGARVARTRALLERHALEKGSDGAWGLAGRPPNATAVREVVGSPRESEARLARRLRDDARLRAASVVVLREDAARGDALCWAFNEGASGGGPRFALFEALGAPAARLRAVADALARALRLETDAVVAHWRSTSNRLMNALGGQGAASLRRAGALSPREWAHYFTDCAADVARGADDARALLGEESAARSALSGAADRAAPATAPPRANNLSSVVFFSDIDAAAYVEFDHLFARAPALAADRDAARDWLAARPSWTAGDRAIIDALRRARGAKGGAAAARRRVDAGAIGIVVELLSLRARAFVSCAAKSCEACARRDSLFTGEIVRARRAAADRARACATFTSWQPPLARQRACDDAG